ncbi:unnamed protein product [Ostreobium quekettii]|uniref:Uncharacterized protein n=1 Tax=Ostreobium quekettii TaxID=121088 RepID=A0A8S1J5W3_9CHLO|nr:unnamed protein product [Ostreobium quekettii]
MMAIHRLNLSGHAQTSTTCIMVTAGPFAKFTMQDGPTVDFLPSLHTPMSFAAGIFCSPYRIQWMPIADSVNKCLVGGAPSCLLFGFGTLLVTPRQPLLF